MCDLARRAGDDVDVIGLKDAAHVRFVRHAASQALDGGFLVAEGLQERERKLGWVERTFGQSAYSFLDFNRVHFLSTPSLASPASPTFVLMSPFINYKSEARRVG